MTVTKLNSTSQYIGLSTDTKPRAEAGSTFFETDTRAFYVVSAVGVWTLSDSEPSDYLHEVSAGRIAGASRIHKFGRNADVDAREDIWEVGGIWVPPTVARTHQIVSTATADAGSVLSSGTIGAGSSTTVLIDSSATFSTDTVSAGDTAICDETFAHATVTAVVSETELTLSKSRHNRAFIEGNTYRVVTPTSTGASIVHVKGLSSTMVQQSEFIVTNGQTNVPTAKTYLRINRMHIDGAVGRGTNVGNITATADTDATVSAQITALRGQTLMAIDTIPSNKRGFIYGWSVHLNKAGGVTPLADMSLVEYPFADVGGAGYRLESWTGVSVDAPEHQQFSPPLPIDPNTDILIRCEGVSTTNLDISADFDMVLEDLDGDTGG